MTEALKKTMNDAMSKVRKRLHCPIEVMLVCVRWYAAYPLSLRNLEEMMAERGVEVAPTTVHRWAIKMLPLLALMLRQRKRPVGLSWRMDETYVLVGGQWKSLYRAVDKAGQTIDFLLRAHRDYAAARCFFERAIDLYGVPEKIIDKSAPTPKPSRASAPTQVRTSRCGNQSTSTTSSSKTTGLSSEWRAPCSGSRTFAGRVL